MLEMVRKAHVRQHIQLAAGGYARMRMLDAIGSHRLGMRIGVGPCGSIEEEAW
jgi:hypothetical protein